MKVFRLGGLALLFTGGALPLSAQTAGPVRVTPQGVSRAQADSTRYPYTEADISFMTGMIAHHGQALVMAAWAPSHTAGGAVRRLCERIINAQNDEIRLMQQWLANRGQPFPVPGPEGTAMPGHEGHPMQMPGMLTPDQLRQLDQSRGTEFDRLFLTFMIQHHKGAVEMVKQLFANPGAGRDLTSFKLASDINVDQTTEIRRMEQMLAAIVLSEGKQP